MFGKLPAHGLYCRHVRGLTLSGVRLETDEPDGRHALALDDVQDANISGLTCSHAPAAASLDRSASNPQRADPRLPARRRRRRLSASGRQGHGRHRADRKRSQPRRQGSRVCRGSRSGLLAIGRKSGERPREAEIAERARGTEEIVGITLSIL